MRYFHSKPSENTLTLFYTDFEASKELILRVLGRLVSLRVLESYLLSIKMWRNLHGCKESSIHDCSSLSSNAVASIQYANFSPLDVLVGGSRTVVNGDETIVISVQMAFLADSSSIKERNTVSEWIRFG